MKLTIPRIQLDFFKVIFSLMLAAFITCGTSLVDFLINRPERVALCLIVLIFLFFKNRLFRCFNNILYIVFFSYIAWCILTSLWSNDFSLSLMKSTMMGVVGLTCASAGYEWVRRYGWKNSLHWLIIILAITLLSGVFGWLRPTATYVQNNISVYRGLVASSNAMGFFCAITFPLLIWQCTKKKKLWFGLAGLNSYYLVSSCSRSAFLIAMVVGIFFVLSLNLKKKIFITYSSCLLAILFLLFTPTLFDNYIYKNTEHVDVLASRNGVWKMSYDAAVEGGVFGAGYSVALKPKSAFTIWDYDSVNKVREKSNSQLAVIEETGLIGLSLYISFLITLLVPAVNYWRNLQGEPKVVFGLVLGAIFGLILQSGFEAWWTGPFAQENASFWTLVGVARGLMHYVKNGEQA